MSSECVKSPANMPVPLLADLPTTVPRAKLWPRNRRFGVPRTDT
jgi:hypothetical protein